MRTRAILLLLWMSALAATQDADLLTVAEKSDYKATASHADVMRFVDALAKRFEKTVRVATLGESFEGRKLPLLILADPPVATVEEAKKSGKLVTFTFGNIHAGEVCGKEALCMLAREMAAGDELFKDLVVVFAPIYNADGNERVKKDNRPGQVGPEEGMGQRANAQGFDLNREYVKLESPEARALVRFYRKWDPAVIIDTHTTNGSHHGYALTYASPRNPAGDAKVIEFVRDTMLPEVSRRVEKASGYRTFFYGNFNRAHDQWRMSGYPAQPRFGTVYNGIRNRVAILSEAYAYASYKDRVLATRAFVRGCLAYAAEKKDDIRKLIAGARRRAIAAKPGTPVAIRSKAVVLGEKVQIRGFVEEERDGRRVATDTPRTYEVEFYGKNEPTLTVKRPWGYLLPATLTKVVENLQRHGIRVDELREDIELDLEVYRVDRFQRRERAFQGHKLARAEVTARKETRRVPAGTVVVRTGQEHGALAVFLLEPQSEDGLLTWNFFDERITEGGDFPVVRIPDTAFVRRGSVRPLEEDRTLHQRVTFKALYESRDRPNFSGSAAGGITWLEDSEHFLQRKGGGLRKVHALSGRSEAVDPGKEIAKALASLPTIDKPTARRLARRPRWDEKREGAFFTHENDLYHCTRDGKRAVRLTHTPGRELYPAFSPDGRFVAFVRDFDVHVVDVLTQTERALTTGGTDMVRNGHLDWVYMEELYGRGGRRAFWWSPKSTHIAFLQLDDGPVKRYTVINEIPVRQNVENVSYPKAGDPNPKARLGLVSAAGGTVRWVDLSSYLEGEFLITRVGWRPDGAHCYFYIQDRAQTWLDFCTVAPGGGKAKRLFRDTTKAWVSRGAVPEYLKDGSFLFPSERSGWRHLYHYDKNGKLEGPVTAGEWEVRRVSLVDEKLGWIYFTGTRDEHIQSHLYRVKLDGSGLERLTAAGGSHRTTLSPDGRYFVDSWSDHKTPTRVALFETATRKRLRTLDTNPVYDLEEYDLGKYEMVKIRTKDGFVLEGSVLLPPDFDAGRKYPVWFMTYGGPHAPTIRDSWRRGGWDEMLANLGFIVFRADPRSASGKGAVSAWACYRQMGVSELQDIGEAIEWLKQRPYVDGKRIGMSGHSYGGFMTAYAMTHSKLFAAGIAGAPVTDWHNYDTIYTERYMNTPQENPDGYEKTSVVKAAKDIHGRILIAHGVMDDNVHMANTLQFMHALQRADKQFDVMLYPRNRHGFGGMHYRRLQLDFITRTLGGPETPEPGEVAPEPPSGGR